jgi:hypothetical protein
MRDKLFVLFTMDVEPRSAGSGTSGPASDEAGMRAVEDFQAVLESFGYRATYFVHPELVAAYPEFYRGLEQSGSGLGLHLHATKFAEAPQPCELGGLTPVGQRDLLDAAAGMFERGLGVRPTIFRPGCFSASDATYGILCDLGFVGGSVCIPGRIWADRFCVWAGAYPYAHFAHRAFRQGRGDLPFVEIPLSVDMTGPLRNNPVGFEHYPDLRPGGVYSETDEVPYDRRELLENILRRMAADEPPLKTPTSPAAIPRRRATCEPCSEVSNPHAATSDGNPSQPRTRKQSGSSASRKGESDTTCADAALRVPATAGLAADVACRHCPCSSGATILSWHAGKPRAPAENYRGGSRAPGEDYRGGPTRRCWCRRKPLGMCAAICCPRPVHSRAIRNPRMKERSMSG